MRLRPHLTATAWIASTWIALLWLAPFAGFAQDLEVNVRGGSGRAYQVAVQRFATDPTSGSYVDPFYTELTAAIEFAAGFKVIPFQAFLEPAQTMNLDAPMIPCDNWRGMGSDILLEGKIAQNGNKVRVRYRIWDVTRCRNQGSAAYIDTTVDDLWLAARQLADELVYRFTGRRGVAATQIAYVSNEGGNKEVYVMEADGSRRRRVTANKRINLFPSWSPDGNTLLYTSYRAGTADLWMLLRGRKGKRLLNVPEEKYRGIFGPEDGQITFVMHRKGNTDLYLTRSDGQGLKRLTNNRAIEVSPTWSPDGSQLAFASDRSGNQQIYVMGHNGSGGSPPRRLTFKGSYNASPAWSPTGEWIVFAARVGGDRYDLYLIDPETLYTVQLTDHPRSEENPAWSPDGRKIVFSSDRRGRKDLYVVDLDGRNLRRITEGSGDKSGPDWSGWTK